MNARPARLFDGVLAGYQGAGRRGRRGLALVSAASGLDPAGAGITGSLIVAASIAGVGLVGVGAVAGQVASTSRGTNALGSTILVSSMSSGWSVISATGG